MPILCRELGIPLKHAHTALSDAQATAELLFLREKMTQLPKGLLERLLEMADALYESYLVIEETYRNQSILSSQTWSKFKVCILRKRQLLWSYENYLKTFLKIFLC